MLVFRIARKKHISDLSGLGAKLFGGRWNLPGTAVVYTSETRSLAMVEFLVHVSYAHLPADIHLATLKLPDQAEPEILSSTRLPKNWREHPAPDKLARLGTEWARSGKSLLLQVPSVIVEQEYNILMNPSHPDAGRIEILKVEAMKFDRRLIRQV